MFIYLYIFESFHSFRDSRQEDSIFHDQHFNPEQIFSPMLTYIFYFFLGLISSELDSKSASRHKGVTESLKKSLLMFPSADGRRKPCVPFSFWYPGFFGFLTETFGIFFYVTVSLIVASAVAVETVTDRQTDRRQPRDFGFADRLRTSPRRDGLSWTVESHESNFPPDVSPVLCAAHEDDGICGPVFPTNTNKSSLCSLTERPCLLSKLS